MMQPDTLPLGDGHMPDVTDVIAKGELPVIDTATQLATFGANPFRALVTEVLNIDPNLRGHRYHLDYFANRRYAGHNPRRNAERKLVKAHGFRQFKKARQVARFILREQAIREQAAKELM